MSELIQDECVIKTEVCGCWSKHVTFLGLYDHTTSAQYTVKAYCKNHKPPLYSHAKKTPGRSPPANGAVSSGQAHCG